MRLQGRDGDSIESFDDWKNSGKPAAEHHWKEGRSAVEMARYWTAPGAPTRVEKLLSQRPELAGIQLIEGIVEKKTRFDIDPRGPRNHDLLIRGEVENGPVVIGVEGKADEPFDHPLWRWRKLAMERTPTSKAPARLDRLTEAFFGSAIDTDRLHPSLGCLGYQLLSALAGTLADALTEPPAIYAVLLIHEFVTNETDDELHRTNAADLDDFVLRLGGHDLDRIGDEGAWITAPVEIRGDGEWMPQALSVSIAKLVTRLR